MRLVFDIETNGFLRSSDPAKVADRIHCIVAQDLDSGEVHVQMFADQKLVLKRDEDEVYYGLELLGKADTLIGANIIGYDLPVLKKLCGWEPKPTCVIRDTQVCSALVYSDLKDQDFKRIKGYPGHPARPELAGHAGNHGLKAWGLRLGEHKGDYDGGFETFSQEMLDYCVQDVKTTVKLWRHLEKRLPPEGCVQLEHEFAEVLARQERKGVLFDMEKATVLQGTLAEERQALDVQIEDRTNTAKCDRRRKNKAGKFEVVEEVYCPELTVKGFTPKTKKPKFTRHSFNPSSDDHKAKYLIKKYGWKPTVMTEGGKPKMSEEVVAGLPYPEAKLFARHKALENRLTRLSEGPQALIRKVEDDGRIHGRIHHNGTLTGRCSHTSPNMNLPTPKKPWGKEFRELCTVPEGHRMVGCDARGLELRMLAHYLGKYDRGAYRDLLLSGDVHTATANATGLSRDDAKTLTYAILYGAGDAKVGTIKGEGPRAGKVLKQQFMDGIPGFEALMESLNKTLRTRGYIKGLDGRMLRPRKANSLLNTLLQSAGAVVMKKATVILDQAVADRDPHRRTACQVLHVHDEFQYEVGNGFGKRLGALAVASIQEAGIHFNLRCPLDGEYKIGSNWAETH